MTLTIHKHTSNYNQLAEELQGTNSAFNCETLFGWTTFLTELYVYS